MSKSTAILVALLLAGCASEPLRIPTVTRTDYQVLGEGKGKSMGIMLFNVIPIGQNERFVKAYNKAVESMNGDALINPVISEHWFWGYILNGYDTKIEGTVIRYNAPKEQISAPEK